MDEQHRQVQPPEPRRLGGVSQVRRLVQVPGAGTGEPGPPERRHQVAEILLRQQEMAAVAMVRRALQA
jgi:hypothetical protein